LLVKVLDKVVEGSGIVFRDGAEGISAQSRSLRRRPNPQHGLHLLSSGGTVSEITARRIHLEEVLEGVGWEELLGYLDW